MKINKSTDMFEMEFLKTIFGIVAGDIRAFYDKHTMERFNDHPGMLINLSTYLEFERECILRATGCLDAPLD